MVIIQRKKFTVILEERFEKKNCSYFQRKKVQKLTQKRIWNQNFIFERPTPKKKKWGEYCKGAVKGLMLLWKRKGNKKWIFWFFLIIFFSIFLINFFFSPYVRTFSILMVSEWKKTLWVIQSCFGAEENFRSYTAT